MMTLHKKRWSFLVYQVGKLKLNNMLNLWITFKKSSANSFTILSETLSSWTWYSKNWRESWKQNKFQPTQSSLFFIDSIQLLKNFPLLAHNTQSTYLIYSDYFLLEYRWILNPDQYGSKIILLTKQFVDNFAFFWNGTFVQENSTWIWSLYVGRERLIRSWILWFLK